MKADGGGLDWESPTSRCKLLYVEWINNKVLLLHKDLYSISCNKLCMCVSCSDVSDSLRPHRLQSASLLCSWNSPGKNTGVGGHSLFQGIFATQGLNPGLPHCRQIRYVWATREAKLLTLRKASAIAKESLQNRFPDPSHQLWEEGSVTAAYDLILYSYLRELPAVYAEGKLLVLTHCLCWCI